LTKSFKGIALYPTIINWVGRAVASGKRESLCDDLFNTKYYFLRWG
jgi:hypothetical protein